MSTQRERLVLELEIVDKGGAAKLKGMASESERLKGKLSGLNSQVRDLAKTKTSWLGVIRDVSVSTASMIYILPNLTRVTWSWQASILGVSAEMERAAISLSNFQEAATRTEKIEKANKAVEDLLKQSKQLPFEFKALQDSMVKMTTGLGDQALPVMNGLTEAIASFGGSDEMLKRASVAIMQMSGKGVVSMEELRQQLGEAVPSAARLMARSLSMSYADFVKEVSEGRVSAGPAIKAMGEEMVFEAEGSASRLMATYGGLTSQIKTQFTMLGKEVGDTGYFDAVKEQMQDFLKFMESQEALESARVLGFALKSIAESMSWLVKVGYEYREVLGYLSVALIGMKTAPALFGLMGKSLGAATTGANSLSRATNSILTHRARQEVIERRYASQAYLTKEYNKQITAVKQATLAMGYRKTMTSAVTTAERLQAEAMTRTNVERQKAIAQQRSLNNVSRAFGPILSTVGGVIGGILIGAITAYIMKIIKANGETKRLAETLRNLESSVSFADIENARDSLVKLEERKKLLQDQIAAQKRQQNGEDRKPGEPYVLPASNSMAEKFIDDFKAEIAEIETQMESITNSLAVRTPEAIQNSVDTQFAALTRNFEKQTEDAKELNRKAMADLEKYFNETGLMTKDEYFQAQQKIRIDQAKGEIAVYESLIAKHKEMIVGDGTDVDQSVTAEMNKQLLKMQGNLKELEGRTGPVDTQFRSFTAVVDKLNAELARNKKETEEIDFELNFQDKFSAIAAGVEKWAMGNNDVKEVLAKIKVAMTELEVKQDLLAKHKGLQSMADTVESLGNKYARMGRKAIESLTNMDNEFISNSNLAGYASDLDRLNVDLQNLGFSSQLSSQKVAQGINQIRAEAAALGLVMPEMIANIASMRDDAMIEDIASTTELVGRRIDEVNDRIAKVGKEAKVTYQEQVMQIDKAIAAIRLEETATGSLTAEQRNLIESMNKLKGLYGDLEVAEGKQTTELEKMMETWKDHQTMFDSVVMNGMESFASSMADMLTGSSGNWKEWSKELIKNITQVIVKLMLMKAVIDPLLNSMGLGGTGSGGGTKGAADIKTFAKGGVMTSAGDLPLKKYAKGGVTSFPQRALFGEGTTPEAYVPLPDGRTIPVTIANAKDIGPSKRGQTGSVPVQVNLFNQGGEQQEAESTTRFDGERMIVDVVLKNLSRPTPMRDAVRGVR